MKDFDIIIFDLYKLGFCSYLVGVIVYRIVRINDVLSLMVEVDIFYYYGSVNLGNWGIEGFKLGNSVVVVYLVSKVR